MDGPKLMSTGELQSAIDDAKKAQKQAERDFYDKLRQLSYEHNQMQHEMDARIKNNKT